MRVVATDPNQRPQTAAELSASLIAMMRGAASAVPVEQVVPVLAVLDFQNITDDRSVDWLGTGLAETLTTDLKKLKLVKVVSRDRLHEATRRLRLSEKEQLPLIALGTDLNARWLVLGSYQRAGDDVRILPRLLDVVTGEEIAIPKIDGSWKEIFLLQDQVVADVMTALELKIDSGAMERIAPPETLHLEAYEQYAQGRQRLNLLGKESLQIALRHLENAVRLDPNYALAYAALGATHAMRYIHRTDPSDLEYAARYLERSIKLDPELGEPYPWLSYAYMRQGKVEQAIRTGHKGVELQPDLVIAHYFLGVAYLVSSERDPGLYQLAATYFLDATLADPRWGPAWLCLAHIALICGEYESAEQFLRKSLEIEHGGPGFGYFPGSEMLLAAVAHRRADRATARRIYASSALSLQRCDAVYREAFLALTACGLGDLLLREGDITSALIEFRRASRLVKEFPRMLGRKRVLARVLTGMGATYAAQNEDARSRQLLDDAAELIKEIATSPQTWLWEGSLGQLWYGLAAAYMRLDEQLIALGSLDKALAVGWRDGHWMESDPELLPLRSQAHFQELQENLRFYSPVVFEPSHPNRKG